ncbi:MAG: hypothetical protein FIA95_14690 [Gemmatimonadetes bacterium]|nr:hypothetical protein [Gemmatimonadota bacterium]
MRRSADRIRIGVQLTDARSGYNLWSETYDRPISDLFAVQETIAGEIVRALAGRLAPTQQRALYVGGTKDLEAYDRYLQGRQRWATRQIPQLREAVEDFGMAIQRDSAFALAWSGLADAIEALAWRVPAERPRIAEGKYAAQRALALEPALAEAWTSVGGIAMDFDRDFTMAELTLRRAIALKPSYAVPYNWLGDALRYSGRIDAALEVSTQGIRLDPLNGGALNTHVSLLVRKGRVTEARRFADQSLAIGFQDSGMFLNLLSAVRVLGYTAEDAEAFATGWAAAVGHPHPEAVALVGRAVMDPELRPSARSLIHELSTMQVRSRDLATLSLCIEDMDGAIGYLQRGLEEGDPNLIMIGTSRAFDPLRSDPRFIRIVEALGLPNGA